MLDPKTLEEIGNKMNALLANSPARDLEKNARAAVSGLLAKLDVVTREEFDIQTQVLARTPRETEGTGSARRGAGKSADGTVGNDGAGHRSQSGARWSECATRSRWKCIWQAACRSSRWSACRTPKSRRRGDRVRAAIVNSGFEFPSKRITVNLAPADLPKESGRFDLPIALGMLAASGQIPAAALNDCEFAGELSLSGELRPIRGALAMALQTAGSGKTFVLPEDSAREAALIGSGDILAARSLLEVCAHLSGQGGLPGPAAVNTEIQPVIPDLNEVRGQSQAKRALEVAAAGGHSLLMIGPPGSGKSMLAARLPGLLPMLDGEAAKSSAAVLSLVGQFRPEAFGLRPYRQPHHTASAAALVGGGNPPRPGEVSLAHEGVLFLDELPEFDRKVLETLREPLESGISISPGRPGMPGFRRNSSSSPR
jgi:hypothetical protein